MTTETSNKTDTPLAANSWHIVQQTGGHCEILSQTELAASSNNQKTWGPFASRAEAIAKRVGLIRAGKCLPK
ncbi:MAG: DDE transposase family protein [Cyanobacteria bacterium P01_F01_bin.13]